MIAARIRCFALLGTMALAVRPVAAAPPSQTLTAPLASPSPSRTAANLTRSRYVRNSAAVVKAILAEIQKGPRVAHVAKRGLPPGFVNPVASTTEIAHPDHPSVHGISATSVTGSPGFQKLLAWQKACSAGDPSAPPEIWRVRGSITANGLFTIEGACFGEAPAVRFLGNFPGGELRVRILSSSSDKIDGQILDVTGVYDQQVTIRVIRGQTPSNDVQRAFVTPKEQRVVTASQVLGCGSIARGLTEDPPRCTLEGGQHTGFIAEDESVCRAMPDGLNGLDTYKIDLRPGWRIDSVDYWDNGGNTTYLDGATPDTFSISWKYVKVKDVWKTTVTVVLSDSCEADYAAVYSFKIHVIGPKGTF